MPIDRTLTPARRELIDSQERDRLGAAGALTIDARRSRPRYFDGRFLAARDLTADQQYALTREADLGRAAGSGVVEGLLVTATERATDVRISSGLAITPSGETLVLPEDVTVDLFSLRAAELLDAQLGLRRKRTVWSRVRTGAFVLCLRAVEYSAHPRRGYPTSIDGERTSEDHDIVEATAVTLVPWPTSYPGSADDVRRQLASEIFAQEGRGLAADLVPLALVYLDGVALRFIDVHLVRRMIGVEQEDLLGLGVVPRAVRSAHVQQYRQHLRDLLASSGARPISAAEHFDVLPPVGELPAAALHRSEFTESFFPPTVDVDLSVVPSDELALIVEETMTLPPIDLRAEPAALAAISVMVLVPVERARYRTFQDALVEVRRSALPRSERFARATALPLLRQPLPTLARLPTPSSTRLALALPGSSELRAQPRLALTEAEGAAWTALLDEAVAPNGGLFWYVRRPNFSHRADLEGALIDMDVVGESP